MAEEQSFFIPFLEKKQINYDAWNFYFEKPFQNAQGKPAGFKYRAGQYIKIKLPINNPDNRGISRYFTLSSSPTEEYLCITTRIIKSTFKATLSNLEKGARVEARGPWGDFVLDENDKKPFQNAQGRQLIFLAGGIGLTPFRSMLKYISDMKLDIPIMMFNSYKTEKDAELALILESFQKEIPHFSLKIMYERITSELLQKELDLNSKHMYYIAGPEKMVSTLASSFKKIGMSADLDRYEGTVKKLRSAWDNLPDDISMDEREMFVELSSKVLHLSMKLRESEKDNTEIN